MTLRTRLLLLLLLLLPTCAWQNPRTLFYVHAEWWCTYKQSHAHTRRARLYEWYINPCESALLAGCFLVCCACWFCSCCVFLIVERAQCKYCAHMWRNVCVYTRSPVRLVLEFDASSSSSSSHRSQHADYLRKQNVRECARVCAYKTETSARRRRRRRRRPQVRAFCTDMIVAALRRKSQQLGFRTHTKPTHSHSHTHAHTHHTLRAPARQSHTWQNMQIAGRALAAAAAASLLQFWRTASWPSSLVVVTVAIYYVQFIAWTVWWFLIRFSLCFFYRILFILSYQQNIKYLTQHIVASKPLP